MPVCHGFAFCDGATGAKRDTRDGGTLAFRAVQRLARGLRFGEGNNLEG